MVPRPSILTRLIFDESWRIPLGIFPKEPQRPLRLDEIPPSPPRDPRIKRLDEI